MFLIQFYDPKSNIFYTVELNIILSKQIKLCIFQEGPATPFFINNQNYLTTMAKEKPYKLFSWKHSPKIDVGIILSFSMHLLLKKSVFINIFQNSMQV